MPFSLKNWYIPINVFPINIWYFPYIVIKWCGIIAGYSMVKAIVFQPPWDHVALKKQPDLWSLWPGAGWHPSLSGGMLLVSDDPMGLAEETLRKSVVWWLNDIGWLVVWIMGFFSLWLVNFIIPTDFHISQRGRSTTNDIVGGMWLNALFSWGKMSRVVCYPAEEWEFLMLQWNGYCGWLRNPAPPKGWLKAYRVG